MNAKHSRVAVVGGGLAGLAGALYLARAGFRVDLFEKSTQPGGRARTMQKSGFLMNLGAHALYANGACRQVLDELQISYSGARPDFPFRFIENGRELPLPVSISSLLLHRGYNLREKWEFLRVAVALLRADLKNMDQISMRDWLYARCKRPRVRVLFEGLFRLGTYTADLDILSADAGIAQFRLGQGGVYYLDGGWQTLIDRLGAALRESGGRLRASTGVERLARRDSDRIVVHLSGAQAADAPDEYDFVLLACDPATAARLAADLNVSLPARQTPGVTVRAACLDVGLSSLPVDAGLVLDFDRRLYFSIHSKVAQLTSDREDGALIHLIKNLRQDEDPGSARAEMEMLLDRLQPGWRDRQVAAQYLPRIAVIQDLPDYRRGGLAGRTTTDFGSASGVYFAGDWVGDEGLLSDAAMASARRAAAQIADVARSRSDSPELDAIQNGTEAAAIARRSKRARSSGRRDVSVVG